MCGSEPDDVPFIFEFVQMWSNYRIKWLLSGSLCLHRRQCYCRPFRRRLRTMLPYWRATQGGPIRRTFSVNNRLTIGGQSWLYRLYYPLCVSRRIDTWQIVYLSYKDPCPTISIHKRFSRVPWVHPWPVPIQRANAHAHGYCPILSLIRRVCTIVLHTVCSGGRCICAKSDETIGSVEWVPSRPMHTNVSS